MTAKTKYLKIILTALLFVPMIAFAAINVPDAGLVTQTPAIKDVVVNIAEYILGFAAAIAVLFIIYGGIVYMSSSGDEKRTASAKGILTSSIIGLLVVLFALVIVNLTLDLSCKTAKGTTGTWNKATKTCN